MLAPEAVNPVDPRCCAADRPHFRIDEQCRHWHPSAANLFNPLDQRILGARMHELLVCVSLGTSETALTSPTDGVFVHIIQLGGLSIAEDGLDGVGLGPRSKHSSNGCFQSFIRGRQERLTIKVICQRAGHGAGGDLKTSFCSSGLKLKSQKAPKTVYLIFLDGAGSAGQVTGRQWQRCTVLTRGVATDLDLPCPA